MPIDPYRYRSNRALLAIACLLAAVAAGLLMWPGEVTGTRRVSGVVMEVGTGEGRSLRSGNATSLVTARVALDDGHEVRVLVTGMAPTAGQTVTLVETRYSDGSTRYRLE